MGKRFQKFLLENLEKENKSLHNQDIESILKNIDGINVVRFALYCAKDVLELNNEITRQSAERGIELIEKYLHNLHSVNEQELLNSVNNIESDINMADNAADYTFDTRDIWSYYVAGIYAAWAASYATWTAISYSNHYDFSDVSSVIINAATAKVYTNHPLATGIETRGLIEEESNNYKRILISRFTRKYENPNDQLTNLATNDSYNQNEANLIFWDYILDNNILQHFTEIGDDGMISFNLGGIHLAGKTIENLEDQIRSNERLFNNVINIIRSTIRK